MPKMKTNRAAAKRFRVTAGGVKRGKAGKQHIMRGKSARRLRRLKKNDLVAVPDIGRVQRMMPYEF